MIALILLAALAIVSGIALAVQIPHDGYGTRPGPRSHIDPLARQNRFTTR